MGGRLRIVAGITGLLMIGLYPAQAQQAPAIDKTNNVKLVKQFKYEGGTELVGHRRFRLSRASSTAVPSTRAEAPCPTRAGCTSSTSPARTPKEVGFLHCPGNDNDVEALKPGIVLMGFATNKCAPSAGNGFMVVNSSRPQEATAS